MVRFQAGVVMMMVIDAVVVVAVVMVEVVFQPLDVSVDPVMSLVVMKWDLD